MSKNATIALWVIVAILVIAGIWWWVSSSMYTAPSDQTNPYGATTTTSGTSGTSDNNASLNASLSQVDSQSSNFNSDSASMDQGLNDQPVQQEQL